MSEEVRLEETAASEVETEELETSQETEEVESEAEETEENEESGTSEDGEEDATAKPKKRGVHKRIAELTAARRQAEREAEYWKQYAEQFQQTVPPTTPDVGAKPKLADFDYDEAKYEAAVDEWHQKRFQAQQEYVQKRQQEFQQVSTQAQKAAQRAAFVAQAAEQYEDFAQVVNPNVPISDVAADVILESDHGAAVAYFLGKNPEEAYRIYQLPEHKQAYEIAKIEARISAPPKPKQTTGAPPPPKKVKPSGSVQKNPDDMSVSEWLEWRNKQLSSNRG